MPRPSDPNARVKLLAAAERVFVTRGLDGAKVEEITARAGVAKGTFYLHFENKEDAFRRLVEAMVARLAEKLDSISEGCVTAADDLPTFLDLWVSQDAEIFEFVWQNRGLVGLLLEGGKSAGYRHLVDEFLDRAAAKSRLLLTAGIAAGLYRADLDLDVAASFIAGAYDRLARDVVKETRRPDVDAKLRSLQVLILRGIGSAELLVALGAPKAKVTSKATAATGRGRKRARA